MSGWMDDGESGARESGEMMGGITRIDLSINCSRNILRIKASETT